MWFSVPPISFKNKKFLMQLSSFLDYLHLLSAILRAQNFLRKKENVKCWPIKLDSKFPKFVAQNFAEKKTLFWKT
jgi:hypothetical protein